MLVFLYNVLFLSQYLPQSALTSAVEYRFLHTGGQQLTEVNIFYTFTGNTQQQGFSVGIADTMTSISGVVAGYNYTVAVTATNLRGSTTAACSPVLLTSGKDH